MADLELKRLNSRDFGVLEYTESQVYYFKEGLIGINEAKNFILLNYNEQYYILHSLEHEDLYFVLTEASTWDLELSIDLSEKEVTELDLKAAEDVSILLMVKLDAEDLRRSRIHLKAPLILNTKNNQAMQKIIEIKDETIDLVMDEDKSVKENSIS